MILRTVARFIAQLALVALTPLIASAQDPTHRWLSITTPHFRVHFTAELEPLARRVAAGAERAYAQLAAELTPPRGTIDIVLNDDVDVSNGSATPSPSNRIVLNAAPPVGEAALRYNTDWAQLVVTHELTHIFHLDRSRGIWALGQKVFGRSPFLFPNLYSPSWLAEGLAVYYESRLTGQGRVEGPQHTLIATAAALDRQFPGLGRVSGATPTYPYGEAAYVYGSLFVDYLARTRGPEHVKAFIESQSVQLAPYLLDIPAKHAFGVSFTRGYRQWRDSLARSAGSLASTSLVNFTPLTRDGGTVSFPRWLSDSTLVYEGTPGRDVYGAYRVGLDGAREQIGRRNSRSPSVPLGDGSLLFAQLEFRAPYRQRSDLFVERDGHQTRLTREARLTSPDARADGAIVAIQIVPGSTRVVRVSRDGLRIVPITTGGLDEQWTEPRWSHRGDRIAVVRSLRGGITQIVVLDTLGAIRHVSVSGEVVAATPSWLPDDAGLIYSLGHDRTSEIIVERFDLTGTRPSSVLPRYASQSYSLSKGIALFDPVPSPNGKHLAAVQLRGNGFNLGVADCCTGGTATDLPLDTRADARTPAVASDSGVARAYSPWRTLTPRYWIPIVDPGFAAGSYRFGGSTAAQDVVGRHALSALLLIPTDNTGLVGNASYAYRGFGLPVLQLGVGQDWSWFRNIAEREQPKTPIGEIRRRVRDVAGSAIWTRQRVRTAMSLSASAGVEQRTYLTVPDGLLSRVDTTGLYDPAVFPRVELGGGFAAYRSPPLAISAEDGVSASVSLRERFRSGAAGTGNPSLGAVGVMSLFKSLDLPGFSHHVIALRTAGGWSDARAAGYYEVGGTSGSAFEIIPGYSVGEGRRTFGVRGFESGSLIGIRAFAASAEYRAPLLIDRFGLGILPFFLQRSSLSLWTDYGSAWCPDAGARRQVCNDPVLVPRNAIASAGAELNVFAGLLTWDVPYRFRVGIAVPYLTARGGFMPGRSFYLTSGVSF